MLYKRINQCRICGNKRLLTVLNLGQLALTGVFPKKNQKVEYGPIELVKCIPNKDEASCGLLQLRHNYNLSKLYGDNYGYRSGLNASMVTHLHELVKTIEQKVELKDNDLIIDIGSNDGTLLKQYSAKRLTLAGIDPTIKKFARYYTPGIVKIPDFFSAKLIRNMFSKKAKVITSIAMFYDLEHPLKFVQEIDSVLADDGVWVFEQSYMPLMIQKVMYDTVCHEHLEYYGLKQIQWLMDRVGFKIVSVETNDANGGSFRVMVAKKNSSYKEDTVNIKKLYKFEKTLSIENINTYKMFAAKVQKHKEDMKRFIRSVNKKGKVIYGYGASTKGNVILQYCGFTNDDIPFIAEVNEYKFGRYAPGTNIPIISETEAKLHKPDYFMVLPWHFRENIIKREKNYLKAGGKLFFPLPKLDSV